MRAFLEIVRFELRFQARSPLFLALLVLTAVIHFCTARKWGIDIGIGAAADAEALGFNSTLAIIQNELVLSLLSIFPAIVVVATAITRDRERGTSELFDVQPIRVPAYFCGRFAGGLLLALAIALTGVLANFVSLSAPGIDPTHLGSFSMRPWWFVLGVIVIPNTVIISALAFAAASAARSISAAWCVALILPLLPIIGMPHQGQGAAGWLALADPFGAVAVVDATRFLTRQELITQLPGGLLWINRLVWLALAGVALGVSLTRYRRSPSGARRRGSAKAEALRMAAPAVTRLRAVARFGAVPTLIQFASQLRMDLLAILKSPPFYLAAVIVIASCAGEFSAPSYMMYNTPRLPLTSGLIGYLDAGLALQIVLVIAYYAGLLTHRERQCRVFEIADASPVATAVGVTGKITALFAMVTLLLVIGIGTFITLQLMDGYRAVEPWLYLKGLIVYGFNHYMLIVPAVLIHLLFSNRWLGTLVFLAAFVVTLSLAPLGYENLLYIFRLPPTPYSDMNGFGHFVVRDVSLMAYWTAFILILVIAAGLAAPRGYYDRLVLRVSDARARVTRLVLLFAGVGAVAFASLGGWIYYNTHILNDYVTSHTQEARAAAYERKYKRYADDLFPQSTHVDIALDMFPAERRVESRGTDRLINDTGAPISDLLVTVNTALSVNRLELEGAELVDADDALGARRYHFASPWPAGEVRSAAWDFSWRNEGFANSVSGNAVAANGINVEASDVTPMFGYDNGRDLKNLDARRREGLPPPKRLPSLDDEAARNSLRYPIRLFTTSFKAVISTSGDQTALTSGSLTRQWREGNRNYFEYEGNFPMYVAFASARYKVAQDQADGVDFEVYYDPRHASAVPTIMHTIGQGLDYYSTQFSPYFLKSFKIFEYPRYSTRVHALAGAVSYNEAAGFTLKHKPGAIDIVTAHELGHMWWGGQIRSPAVQGQEVLNEGLASYSAFMLIEHEEGKAAVYPYLAITHDMYLDAISRIGTEMLPVIRAETGLNTYGKASLVMYALADIMGADTVNRALHNFLADYGNRPPPYPTTRELVSELRAVAPKKYQHLITDLFEKVTFYDLSVTGARSLAEGAGYDVSIDVKARKLYADGQGIETEAPLDAPFDIAVFGLDGDKPLYLAKHWLKTGTQAVTVHVSSRPVRVAVDPYGKMIDRRPDDNERSLKRGESLDPR